MSDHAVTLPIIPDSPAAFADARWADILPWYEALAGVPIRAINGDLWPTGIDANRRLTPDFDAARKVVGYTSVRRKPRAEAVRAAAAQYREMLAAETRSGARDAIAAGTDVLHQALNGKSYEQFVLAL